MSSRELEHRFTGEVAPVLFGGGRDARNFELELRTAYRRAAISMVELDGLASVTNRAMERLVDIDDRAEVMAAGRDRLRMMLLDYEKSYHQETQRIQKRTYDPWGM